MSFQVLHIATLFLCVFYVAESHIPSGGDYRDIPNSFFDSKREVPLVKNFQKKDGSYRFGFKLTDQRREETRTPDGEVSGSYGFVDPSGTAHELQYRAGRQGFSAQGTSLPKAPTYTPEVLEARKKFLNYFDQMKSFLKSMRGEDESESHSDSDSHSEEEENEESNKDNGEEYDSSEEDDNEGGEDSEEEEEHEEEVHEGEEHEEEVHEGEEHEEEVHEGEEHEEEEHQEEGQEGEENEEAVIKLEGNFFEEGHNKRKAIVFNKNKRNTESATKEEPISETAKLRIIARKEKQAVEEKLVADVNKEDNIKQTVISKEKIGSPSPSKEPKNELKEEQKINGETKENEGKELLKEKSNKEKLEEIKKESKRDISSVSKFQNWVDTPQKRRFPRFLRLVRKFISSKS